VNWEGISAGGDMTRPSTEWCKSRGCPHFTWERYCWENNPEKIRRRGICLLTGRQPGNIGTCPGEMESELQCRGNSSGNIC